MSKVDWMFFLVLLLFCILVFEHIAWYLWLCLSQWIIYQIIHFSICLFSLRTFVSAHCSDKGFYWNWNVCSKNEWVASTKIMSAWSICDKHLGSMEHKSLCNAVAPGSHNHVTITMCRPIPTSSISRIKYELLCRRMKTISCKAL